MIVMECEVDETEFWADAVDFLTLVPKHSMEWVWQRVEAADELIVCLRSHGPNILGGVAETDLQTELLPCGKGKDDEDDLDKLELDYGVPIYVSGLRGDAPACIQRGSIKLHA